MATLNEIFESTPDRETPKPKRRRFLLGCPFILEMLALNNRAGIANLQITMLNEEQVVNWFKQGDWSIASKEQAGDIPINASLLAQLPRPQGVVAPESLSLESSDEFVMFSVVPPRTNPDGKPRKIKEDLRRWLHVSVR